MFGIANLDPEKEYKPLSEVYDPETVQEQLLAQLDAVEINPVAAVLKPIYREIAPADFDALSSDVLDFASRQPIKTKVKIKLALAYANSKFFGDEGFGDSLLVDVEALEAEDDSFETHYFRGIIYSHCKLDKEAAKPHFLRAVANNPRHAASVYNLVRIYAENGERLNFDRAFQYLEQLETAHKSQFNRMPQRTRTKVAKIISPAGVDSSTDVDVNDLYGFFQDHFASETPSLERDLDTEIEYVVDGAELLVTQDEEGNMTGFSASSGPMLHVNGEFPGETGFLNGSIIATDYRRQGLRTRLYNQQIEDLREAGCKEVITDVQTSNLPSLNNLCGKGFSIVGLGGFNHGRFCFRVRRRLVDHEAIDFTEAVSFNIDGKSDEEIAELVEGFYGVTVFEGEMDVMGKVDGTELKLLPQ